MGSFGERLRREREKRGVTLEEISAATKIGTRSLRALEQEEFNKLPGGIFNKGFVRAYAKFLGIDEEQTVAEYNAAMGEYEGNNQELMQKLVAESERRAQEARAEAEARNNVNGGRGWGWMTALVVFVALAFGVWHLYSTRAAQDAPSVEAQQNETPASVTPSPEAAPVPAPANETPPQSPSGTSADATPAPPLGSETVTSLSPDRTAPVQADAASATEPGFVVVVRARKESWISASADGRQLFSRILKPETTAPVRAKETVKLVVGNAGGVEISFNGKPIDPVGDENRSRTLVFTPQGLQD